MYSKLLCILLFTCRIISNESAVHEEESDSESVETTTRARLVSTRPDGYFEFPDVQAVYRVYEDVETTWYEARDRCAAEGAILAIPDSVEKIRHIKSLQTKQNEDKWLHTGIWKSSTTHEWIRIDNDLPPSFISWIEDSPDSDGDCTGVALADDGLINYRCEWGGEHYVCEKPIKSY